MWYGFGWLMYLKMYLILKELALQLSTRQMKTCLPVKRSKEKTNLCYVNIKAVADMSLNNY